MGIIKFKPSARIKLPCVYESFQNIIKIHTTNWRVLQECDRDIIIITSSLKQFIVEGLTLADLHNINTNKLTIEKAFEFIRYRILCTVCAGVGKLDWIRIARKSENFNVRIQQGSYYRRDPTIINEHEVGGKILYTSIPKLNKGMELCTSCQGTGLNNPFVKLEVI